LDAKTLDKDAVDYLQKTIEFFPDYTDCWNHRIK
jgi:hypothetical protein